MPLLRKSGIDEAVKVNCIKFITLNTLFYILCDDIALLLHGKVVVCTLGKLLGQNVQGFHKHHFLLDKLWLYRHRYLANTSQNVMQKNTTNNIC